MATRTPLFSRRQLNLIIIVTATVIALLSIPSEPWPKIQRTALLQVPLSYSINDDQPSELRFSFALPQTTLVPSDAARLVLQLLELRIEQTAIPVKLSLHRDRLTVVIRASSSTTLIQALQQLAPLLRQPFESATVTLALKQQRAQQYLDRNQRSPLQKADNWLRRQLPLSQDGSADPATEEALSHLQQRLFSRTLLRLSLTGSDPEPLTTALSTTLEQLDAGQPWAISADSAPTTYQPTATELFPVAALQPLPGRRSALFPQALLLTRLLDELTPETTLRFYPGREVSWLIWLTPSTAESPQRWLNTQIEQIRQRLAAMKDWELERAGDDLRDQLQQRMQQPQAFADQLEAIAFYQLGVDYLPQIDATIAALTRAEIRQQLLQLLQPERFSYPALSSASTPTQQP